MFGLDTNVLVRLLVADDLAQTRRARRFIDDVLARDEQVLVSLLVLVETEWVLRSRYEFDKAATFDALRSLLEVSDFALEDEGAVEEALFHWEKSACGFSDCLIAAHNRRLGCESTATFDTKAARSPGFRAIQ